jgi:hypothetical protein
MAWVTQQAATRINDPDSWWHLRLGNDLIAQHSLAAPAWSVFADRSWVPTQPLPEIAAAYVDRWVGLPGLAWLYGAAAMAVLGTVYLTNRRVAARLPASVATAFTLLAGAESLTSRPQLMSFILLPIFVTTWLGTERDLRPRWWLVPLAWFWSLCHGFWFIGVGYGLVTLVGLALSRRVPVRDLWRLAVLAVGCGLVVVLNPVGTGVFRAPFEVNAIGHYVTEWQRTDLLTPTAITVEIMLVATVAIWVRTRRGVSWTQVLLLLTAVFWLWYAVRMVIVAGLVVSPLFATALGVLIEGAGASRPSSVGVVETTPGVGPTWREGRILAGWAAAMLVVLACVVPHTSDHPGGVPVRLDAQLDRLPPGTRVFNAFTLGGWIAWRHPDLEQYIDGLADAYTPAHFAGYIDAVGAGPGWQAVVRRSRAHVALLEASSPLTSALEHAGWTSHGHDEGYVLLLAPAADASRSP